MLAGSVLRQGESMWRLSGIMTSTTQRRLWTPNSWSFGSMPKPLTWSPWHVESWAFQFTMYDWWMVGGRKRSWSLSLLPGDFLPSARPRRLYLLMSLRSWSSSSPMPCELLRSWRMCTQGGPPRGEVVGFGGVFV